MALKSPFRPDIYQPLLLYASESSDRPLSVFVEFEDSGGMLVNEVFLHSLNAARYVIGGNDTWYMGVSINGGTQK